MLVIEGRSAWAVHDRELLWSKDASRALSFRSCDPTLIPFVSYAQAPFETMASTSSLRLDLYFPRRPDSASRSTRTAFRIPPREEWPILPGSHGNVIPDEDGWGIGEDDEQPINKAKDGRRWLTSMAAWQSTPWITHDQEPAVRPLRSRGSMSSLRSNRSSTNLNLEVQAEDTSLKSHVRQRLNLGGRAGARVAVGTADGSVWVFAQKADEEPLPAGVSASNGDTTPPSLSSSSFSRPREVSPSPSVASQSSRSTRHGGHGRESVSLPPFAGFSSGHQHAASVASDGITVTSPTLGSPPEATSVSNVSPTAWKAQTANTKGDELETRLEAQYHTGSNRESALGGVMEALGLSKHHHNHGHGHAQGSPSPASRSPEHSGRATPSADGSPTANTSMRPPATKPRRHAHNRGSAITVSPFEAMSKEQTNSRHVSATSSSAASRRPSVIASNVDATLTQGTSDVNGTEPDPLLRVTPVVQIRPREASAMVSIKVIRMGPSSAGQEILLFLQRNGLLTAWSTSEGSSLGEIHLARSSSYIEKTSASDALQLPATNNALAGLASPMAALAALRSHTNSPALSASSRGGGVNHAVGGGVSGTATPKRVDGAPADETLDYSFEASFQSMEVLSPLRDAGGNAHVGCYDACKRRFVFLSIKLTPGKGILFEPVAFISMPEGADFPSLAIQVDATKNAYKAQTASYSKDSRSIMLEETVLLQDASVAPAAKPIPTRLWPPKTETVPPNKSLPLPSNIDGAIQGLELVWMNVVLLWTAKQFYVLRIANGALVESARLDVACIERAVMQSCSSPTTRWVVLSSGKGLQLLEIMAGEDTTTIALAMTTLGNTGPWTDAAIQASNGKDEEPTSVAARVHNGGLTLTAICTQPEVGQTKQQPIFDSQPAATSRPSAFRAALPLTMERIVTVTFDGNLVYASLAQLVAGDVPTAKVNNAPRTRSRITLLTVIVNPRTQAKYVFAGYASGYVAFWDVATLQLVAQWSLFTVPVTSLHTFGEGDSTLRLNGCAVIVAEDGTGAVILIDGFKMLSLVPGRGAPLERIAVRADDILLLYGDERARVWDMASQELRRSIGLDQALALLQDGAGAWTERQILAAPANTTSAPSAGVLSTLQPHITGLVGVSAEFRKAIDAASRAANPGSSSRSGTLRAAGQADRQQMLSLPKPKPERSTTLSGPTRTLSILRPILTALWPWRLNPAIDQVLCSTLQVKPPAVPVTCGLTHHGHRLSDVTVENGNGLRTSALTTASVLLTTSSMLQVLTHVEETRHQAQTLLAWLVNELPGAVGLDYQAPSLQALASHLVDPSSDVQASCRRLFASQIRLLSSREVEDLCTSWSSSLAGLAAGAGSTAVPQAESARALALLGFLSLECYTSIEPSVLRDVAKGVVAAIENDGHEQGQLVGLHLCAEGFSVWQQYVDAMRLLRMVSTLAMEQEDGTSTTHTTSRSSVVALGRQTTLRIAEENTPLFMTTLHLDILQATSASHAAVTMRLVAFIVRRKPLILYPNLPRLAEAVVKSLDPTSPTREAVLPSATMMISELIGTYPSIAFHNKLQRLAIGTHEGAAILYDLKTATRLFILEGHKSKLDGVSFSPDGRRLVTISLSEGRILIWKVGSSLAGFFAPGSMPRQGGTDPSGAYKSMAFAPQQSPAQSQSQRVSVYEEMHEEALPRIDIEWTGEKDVKVDLLGSSMAFNVA